MSTTKRIITTVLILGACLLVLAVLPTRPTEAVVHTAPGVLATAVPSDTTTATETGLGATALPAIGRMAAALVVVIIAIYAVVYLLKRVLHGRMRHAGHGHLLEVVETCHLAPKQSMALVRVADKAVLVGVSEKGMTVLTELDADQTAVALSESVSPPAKASGFRQFLEMAIGRRKPNAADRTEAALSA